MHKVIRNWLRTLLNSSDKKSMEYGTNSNIYLNTKYHQEIHQFATIIENDLLKLIMEMPTKTCESDIIPTKPLKEILPTIIPALTKIANLSINNGYSLKNGNLQQSNH